MGSKYLKVTSKINKFRKAIEIDGDKSISIRALLLGSQAYGKSLIENINRQKLNSNYYNNQLLLDPPPL